MKGGENVRRWLFDLRKSKGLTARELGQRVGVSESYMLNIEHGTRARRGLDVATICKIAEATGELAFDLLNAEMAYLKKG